MTVQLAIHFEQLSVGPRAGFWSQTQMSTEKRQGIQRREAETAEPKDSSALQGEPP